MNYLVVFLLAGLSYAFADCPNGGSSDIVWVERNQSCYYFITTPTNWFEADQYCTYLNPGFADTHLLSIDDADEQTWIQTELAGKPELARRNFWTSGNIIDRRLGWSWAGNGQRVVYTNWAPGEPNQSGKCVQIWGEYGYQWDDADCYGYINFICEYVKQSPSTTNAPATTMSTTNASGTNPSTTNASGTNPSTTNASGTNPSTTNASGTNPSTTNASGTTTTT